MKRLILLVMLAVPVYAQKTLSDGVEELSRQISERIKTAKQQRVAVLPFQDLHHADSDLGAYIAEELSTSLAIEQVDVVERALLDRVISELKLQNTGAIDPATAKKLGKIAGADAIVAGTVTELPTTLNVTCRVIAADTGKVITGARTKITIDADVNTLRKKNATAALSVPEDAQATDDEQLSWRLGALRIVVDKAVREANHMMLTLAVEHSSDKTQRATLPKYSLVDENGDHYQYQSDSQRFTQDPVSIPPGTRARSVFQFDCFGSACNGTTVTVLAPDGKVVLRGIPAPGR